MEWRPTPDQTWYRCDDCISKSSHPMTECFKCGGRNITTLIKPGRPAI